MTADNTLSLQIAVAATAAKARKAATQCFGDTLDIEAWLRHYFPDTFSRPFTGYQREYWQWVASLRADKAQAPRVECHPRGVGKCLAGSTLVLLADGSQKPIADVCVGDSIISYNCRGHRWETDTITNKWMPGVKRVLRVTTASGKSVTLTPEHRVLTLGGWLRAGQLSDRHSIAACDGISPACSAASAGQRAGVSPVAGVGAVSCGGAGGGAVSGGTHPQTPLYQAAGGMPGDVAENSPTYLSPKEQPSTSTPPQKASKGKAKALEAKGWQRTTVKEFLGLSEEESERVEKKVSGWQRGILSTRKDTPHTPKDPYALQWEKVVSVEEAGEEECFDVEVEKNHCLVTNGLVSHNSTGAETAAVFALAKKVKKYVLYVSATDDQATKHLRAIKTKLENPQLLKDYPHLKPKIEVVHKKVANWSAERLRTQGGQIVECISILGNSRGFKSEDSARPDLIVLDDIDSSKESIDVTKKKLSVIAKEILPTGTEFTDVLFPQNLIHRNSICSMILKDSAQILSNCDFSGPFPLVKNLKYEKQPLPNGRSQWVIVAGEPFDPAVGMGHAQHLLQLLGPDAFEEECQQNVTRVAADKDFREWDEIYHVCTWKEIEEGFKRQGYKLDIYDGDRIRIPSRWNVGLGWDVGTTREHPSAVAIVTRPDERFALSDTVFAIGEVIMPEFPYDSTVTPELVSPGRVVRALKRRLHDMGVSQSQIEMALMSHEASSTRNAVLVDLPEEDQVYFGKWRASKGSGVSAIQQLLEVDKTKSHPFRVFPKGHKNEGQPVMGKPRFIVVVAEGQGELFIDGNGTLQVRGAKDAEGQARARFEIPIYSWRNTGEKKIDDDWVDAARGVMNVFAVSATEKTPDERFEDSLPEHLRWETIEAQSRTATKDIYARMVDRYRDSLEEFREQQREGEQTAWEKTWGKFI